MDDDDDDVLLDDANAARSRIVSLIRSLNTSRSMSRTASDISTGQSPQPWIASLARSFLRTPQMLSNKSSSAVSCSRILWYSDQTISRDGFKAWQFVCEAAFHGGNRLLLSRISFTASKMSFRFSLENFEVSFPLRYCCFSSNRKTSESSGRQWDALRMSEMYI